MFSTIAVTVKKVPATFRNLVALSVCSILLLTGCGSSKPEDSLIKACEQLNRNLAALKDELYLFKVKDSSDKLTASTDSGYFITNIGNDTRERNKSEILRKYPFLANELEAATSFSGNLDNIILYKILVQAIKNTDFKTSLTQSEINSIKGDYEDPSADLVDKEIDRILGVSDIYGSHSGGCADVSNYKYELNQKDGEKYPYDDVLDDSKALWAYATNEVEFAYEVISYTNVCKKTANTLGKNVPEITIFLKVITTCQHQLL